MIKKKEIRHVAGFPSISILGVNKQTALNYNCKGLLVI